MSSEGRVIVWNQTSLLFEESTWQFVTLFRLLRDFGLDMWTMRG